MSLITCCLDTETTGFCEPDHRIVEVYADLIDMGTGKRVQSLDQRINPKRSMPIEAQRVHGISLSDLSGMPDWEAVGPTVHAMLSRGDVMVAHNAQFDMSFLNMEFARIGLSKITKPVFCTMENGIWATSIGKKPSLQELCFACGVTYDPALAHAASYDVHRMEDCLMQGVHWGFYDVSAILNASSVAALPSRAA